MLEDEYEPVTIYLVAHRQQPPKKYLPIYSIIAVLECNRNLGARLIGRDIHDSTVRCFDARFWSWQIYSGDALDQLFAA